MERYLIVFVVLVLCISCSSSNKLSVPFSKEVYQSSPDFLRTVSHGESENYSVAERMAIHNAQSELATLVQTLVKNVTAEFNSKYAESEWRSSFQKEEVSISQQTLSNLKVVATKELINSDRRYEIWVVVEVPKKTLVENFDPLFTEAKLKNVEQSKKQFQQLFTLEWDKLRN